MLFVQGCSQDEISPNPEPSVSEADGAWEKDSKSGYIYINGEVARFCHTSKKEEFIGTFDPKASKIEIDLQDGYTAYFDVEVNGDQMTLFQNFSDGHVSEAQYYSSEIYPCGIGQTDEGVGTGGWGENGFIPESNYIFNSKLSADGKIFGYVHENGVEIFHFNGGEWSKKGQKIAASSGSSRWRFDMSDDGNTIIIGEYDPAKEVQFLNVFEWNGTQWKPKGNPIFLPEMVEQSSKDAYTSVDISGNGQVITMAAPHIDNGTLYNAGLTRVFKWSGSDWLPLGEAIYGKTEWELFGEIVRLNEEGDIIAIKYKHNGEQYSRKSGIRVYEWNGNNWYQLGSDLLGEAFGKRYLNFAEYFDMDSSGKSLVIGMPDQHSLNGNQTGAVGVFDYSAGNWRQRGKTLIGDGENHKMGYGVNISKDANTFIARATGKGNAYLNIYQWEGDQWTQEGSNFPFDDTTYSLLGGSSAHGLSLSGDGKRFAISAGEPDSNTPSGLMIFSQTN